VPEALRFAAALEIFDVLHARRRDGGAAAAADAAAATFGVDGAALHARALGGAPEVAVAGGALRAGRVALPAAAGGAAESAYACTQPGGGRRGAADAVADALGAPRRAPGDDAFALVAPFGLSAGPHIVSSDADTVNFTDALLQHGRFERATRNSRGADASASTGASAAAATCAVALAAPTPAPAPKRLAAAAAALLRGRVIEPEPELNFY